MKCREAYYDQLRVLAIISIICCHVGAVMFQNHDLMVHFKTFYVISFFTLGRFVGVPIFVMLSGALLINRDDSLLIFIKKRFNRVFIPFIFWCIAYVLFVVLVDKKDLTYDLIINVFLGVKGSGAFIFWFIWMILLVYITIFIINKLLNYFKSKSDNNKTIFLDILVVLSLIYYFAFNMGYISSSNQISYYSMFIPYAIIGYFLTHYEFTDRKLNNFNISPNIIVKATFIVFIVGYIFFVDNVCLNSIALNKFSACDYFDFRVIIITSALMMFFRYLPKCDGKLTKKINNILSSKFISKSILSVSLCSYGIYFVHLLILRYLEAAYIYPLELYNRPRLWCALLIVVILFLSWGFILILSKIPYLNKISGAPK